MGAEGGEAVVETLFIRGQSLLRDAWDIGADKIESLKFFTKKKLAGEFNDFEIMAPKTIKFWQVNYRLQIAHLGVAAVEDNKGPEAPQRLQVPHLGCNDV